MVTDQKRSYKISSSMLTYRYRHSLRNWYKVLVQIYLVLLVFFFFFLINI